MPEQDRSGAWHQSTLENLLDGCSWAYYLEYVQGLPSAKSSTVAGSATHLGIELHERARLDGRDLPELGDMIVEAESFLKASTVVEPKQYGEVKAALTHWWGTPMKDGGPSHRQWVGDMQPVGVEQYFKTELVEGALPIGGTVDGIYRDGDRIVLVDWKTAGTLSRWGHEGAEHRRQATLYAVGLMLAGGLGLTELPEMAYCVVRRSVSKSKSFEGARRVFVQPSLADVETLGNRIRQAEKVVEQQLFVRKPEWTLCSKEWCPFWVPCMETGEATPYNLLSQHGGDRQDSVSQ